ncbi:hypothetical protein [Agrobacterium sp. CG674]
MTLQLPKRPCHHPLRDEVGYLARDPHSMMRKHQAASAQGRGVEWRKTGTFNRRHAIPVTDVAAWINAANRVI